MHPTQQKLLELSQQYDLTSMGLRQIGKMIGVEHPQKVKFHLQKIGILDGGTKKPINTARKMPLQPSTSMISIPILGLANCGDAIMIAENRIQGMLPISKRLLPSKRSLDNLFAVKAVGASMNQADVNGKCVQDGDYVIVDSNDRDAKDGDYVLSIIDGLANIKKFVVDMINEQIVLQSESTGYFPPIHIHREDIDNYLINGKVIAVIKSPKNVSELQYTPL